jgi:signal peptidase I
MEKGYKHHVKRLKELWKRFWHFFWEEDTLLSWGINIVVAFILIKWVIYPGLGLILATDYPIVAVVSPSMEHQGMDFDSWWDSNHAWYENYNISKEDFRDFSFHNGFNKGDIMVLYGIDGVEVGEVIVFWGGKKEPIIHRAVKEWDIYGEAHFQTKGDNNKESLQLYQSASGARVAKGTEGAIKVIDETDIVKEDLVGRAILRIPYLGYIKIWFVDLLSFLHIIN